MRRLGTVLVAIAGLAAAFLGDVRQARAQDFKLEPAPSLASVPLDKLAQRTIVFVEHRSEKASDAASELIPFDEWVRRYPQQYRFLSLFPGFKEPSGIKLAMYVAEARFRLNKPAATLDLSRYANLAFLEKLDPAIKHRTIAAAEAVPNTDPASSNRAPLRAWCQDAAGCFQSRYRFEGRIPAGILLVNKLRDETKKPIADYIDFQSEIRLRAVSDLQFAGFNELTGLDAPVTGVFEQSIFWVNQVIHSGKILAVIQEHPTDKRASIATVYLALAIRSDVLTKQRDFLSAPILRNLVPAQLLMGRSSFNSGDSISAGLPQFARGRIKAIAGIIEQER
ncbi:hypothetical protein [Pseudorhodoplanes sp.]|uniref:hypothetical protein n=1 Tax=Pseudorhodoplanes sp. TaxID=1934341 RepID=UPI002B9A0932|nr:hypothetical protein [Pseudorhodoplanes sp.]HWV43232.1 hypothetical protein [Pseudorhodoplanes sp.]